MGVDQMGIDQVALNHYDAIFNQTLIVYSFTGAHKMAN